MIIQKHLIEVLDLFCKNVESFKWPEFYIQLYCKYEKRCILQRM